MFTVFLTVAYPPLEPILKPKSLYSSRKKVVLFSNSHAEYMEDLVLDLEMSYFISFI